MIVVVGSTNRPKGQAVAEAFEKVFGERPQVETVTADSGVSAHPTEASESLKGALSRVQDAKRQKPSADFYVGIEGGLLEVDGRFWEIGWVAVADSKGRVHTALSPGLEMDGPILQNILHGKELSRVLTDRIGVADPGQTNGFYGMVTDNSVTRQQAYVEALVFALAPFRHPEYFS